MSIPAESITNCDTNKFYQAACSRHQSDTRYTAIELAVIVYRHSLYESKT